ncbi:hypothetical protein CLI75_12290, partial [Porphyromonas gingivalis]
ESLARKMGGDVLGKRLRPAESKSGRAITIGGVFEDLPHNSSILTKVGSSRRKRLKGVRE